MSFHLIMYKIQQYRKLQKWHKNTHFNVYHFLNSCLTYNLNSYWQGRLYLLWVAMSPIYNQTWYAACNKENHRKSSAQTSGPDKLKTWKGRPFVQISEEWLSFSCSGSSQDTTSSEATEKWEWQDKENSTQNVKCSVSYLKLLQVSGIIMILEKGIP